MRKHLPITLAVTFALALGATAQAGVEGSAHAIAGSAQGVCSNCHIPHKALGDRLWPASISNNGFGSVGNLCYHCHGTGGLAAALATNTALHTNSHPITDLGNVTSTDVTQATNTLPYVHDAGDSDGSASFECSTCHNPHSDAYSTTNATNPAFLRLGYGQLCAECHQKRQFVNGAESTAEGTWGNNYLDSNPGSHPVGTDVDGDTDGDDSVINAAGDFILAFDGGSAGTHILGGHTLSGATAITGGLGCVTCHAVHGLNTDADGQATASSPVESLLVPTYEQSSQNNIATGNGDKFNVLCENCHGANTDIALTDSADSNPSGAGNFTHPLDQMTVINNMGTLTAPAGWPVGSTAGTDMDFAVICESCHQMHPLADGVGASPAITRSVAVCDQCHGTFTDHHPTTSDTSRTAGYSDSVLGYDGSTDVLTCQTCHGSAGGAHNWANQNPFSGASIALAAGWQPANNGRGVGDVAGQQLEQMSYQCMRCHSDDGDPAAYVYTNNVSPAADDPTSGSQPEYQDNGSGSHWIGTNGGFGPGLVYANGEDPSDDTVAGRGTLFDATSDIWPGGGWSRFGTQAGEIRCESCHELEADKNANGFDLLLYGLREGLDQERSAFCEACHGAAPVSGGTHPMTNDTVGRTGQALNTDTSPFATATPAGNAHYTATVDRMNCDSCHQVHESALGGLMLEEGTGTPSWNAALSRFEGVNTQPLCNDCHNVY